MKPSDSLQPAAHEPRIWPVSVPAYHALGEMGLIPERTELLYGQVFHKIPKTPFHSFLLQALLEVLLRVISPDRLVRTEQPITCLDSEPEPDLAIVRGRKEDFRLAHPRSAEMVIEVCVSSHDYDRAKLRAYAGVGIQECWLVLGPEKQIEVHRQPTGDRFAECTLHGPGGQLVSQAVPEVTVDLATLFGS